MTARWFVSSLEVSTYETTAGKISPTQFGVQTVPGEPATSVAWVVRHKQVVGSHPGD